MKNKILIIGIVCLMFTAFSVSAEEFVQPPSGEIQMPRGEFAPGQPPQGGRGTTPPGGMGEFPETEATEQEAPSLTETPSASEETAPQNTEMEIEAVEEEQPADGQPQMPDMNMEGGMEPRGQFNPENMQGFPFAQSEQEAQESEKPYEKWVTPIISAVMLIFGFVFVALYKRKQY